VAAEALSDLERISRQFRPALLAYFRRRVPSHAEAEDMTQEVFIRLAQSKVDTVDSTEAFIFRIATNLLRDRSRRDTVRAAYRNSVLQDDGREIDVLDPHRIAAGRETLGALWAAIQALPEPTQQIFILYRVENVDKQTIADNFGYAVRTVEKHISQAMIFLSRRVGGRS
jgi:RNA polymerase sigma-70 factor (ECF subfamily)